MTDLQALSPWGPWIERGEMSPVLNVIYMVTSYIVSSLRLDDLRTQGVMLAVA
jgi:hypothetical protein